MSAGAGVAPQLFRDVLSRFGAARLRAFGLSMRPAIQPGDVLHLRAVRVADLSTGDVVLFVRHGALVAHRLVAIRGRLLRTRGDAHWRRDPWLRPSQVLGRVQGVTRSCRSGSSKKPRVLPGPRAVL